MEYWDIYDDQRQRTEKRIQRKGLLLDGEYHLLAHVCIFNSKNEMLIQKRVAHKKIWPSLWDVSAGGSVQTGETTQQAAQRELYEELGCILDLSHERAKLTLNLLEAYDDFFLVNQDVDLKTLTLCQNEVAQVKWASEEEILSLLKQGQFVDYGIIEVLFKIKDRWGAKR